MERLRRVGVLLMPSTRLRRAALTIAAVTTAVVIGAAGTAHANMWQLTDNFDSNPAATWKIGGEGGFNTSPTTSAWLRKSDNSGWAEVGRTVHLTPAQFHRAECAASISLRASADGSTSTVNIEVIDPSSWTYIALNKVSVTGSNFQQFNVGPWTPGPVDVYFRVSLLAAGSYRYLGVDSLVVSCAY